MSASFYNNNNLSNDCCYSVGGCGRGGGVFGRKRPFCACDYQALSIMNPSVLTTLKTFTRVRDEWNGPRHLGVTLSRVSKEPQTCLLPPLILSPHQIQTGSTERFKLSWQHRVPICRVIIVSAALQLASIKSLSANYARTTEDVRSPTWHLKLHGGCP